MTGLLRSDRMACDALQPPGQRDLDLLLRVQLWYLRWSFNLCLFVGRAARPEPAAGQSLRRYALRGLPGAPTQLPVIAGPASP